MAVKVQFEIGHTAKLRSKKTPEGFTHDWELYVQGVNRVDISTFVDKVVFNLHDSFPKPKRVCKEPPYVIQESGYAGFLLPIDIYFRNRDEPKRVQFTYDLDLQQTGPPHHRSEIKKFIFESPSEEFRPKLIKGGGVPVAGVIGGSITTTQNSTAIGDEGMVSKPKLSSLETSGKKHKSRTDETKLSTFANLFGSTMSKGGTPKHSPENKNNMYNKSSAISGGGSQTVATNANNSGGGGGVFSREKFIRDRSGGGASAVNVSSAEKYRDKSEKKEKYKQLSPYRDGRSGERKSMSNESSKYEKRGEEKSRKDKLRDRERERSREKGASATSTKRSLSPKTNFRDNAFSPRRAQTPPISAMNARFLESRGIVGAANKFDAKETKNKDQISSSSGKKSKKDKKERDKEREKDKERREDYRDKYRNSDGKPRDERMTTIGNNPINTITRDEKESKTAIIPNSDNSKKYDKDHKMDATKPKMNAKQYERERNVAASVTPTSTSSMSSVGSDRKSIQSSNNGDKDKKSHKHKKRDKNKEKDNEREKEKDIEKLREKEMDKLDVKMNEKRVESPLNDMVETTKIDSSSSQSNSTEDSMFIGSSFAAIKEKNNDISCKDKLSSDGKGHRETEIDTKSKQDKSTDYLTPPRNKSSPINTQTNNITFIDDDSVHSPEGLPQALMQNMSPVLDEPESDVGSDSSNSSFPDLQSDNIFSTVTIKTTNSPPIRELQHAATSSQDHKQAYNFLEQDHKAAIQHTEEDKTDLVERDDRKRRRNSLTGNNYIQPPLKQIKTEPGKSSTPESSSSPSEFNAICNSFDGNDAYLLPPINSSDNSLTSSPTSSTNTVMNANNLPSEEPSSPQLADDIISNGPTNIADSASTPPTGTVTLPTEYLNELQELHQKIMTLQDNEELQQVVEMIAATGCYEITAKTFDFDLCKLDRGTVQRLQDFFATSVS